MNILNERSFSEFFLVQTKIKELVRFYGSSVLGTKMTSPQVCSPGHFSIRKRIIFGHMPKCRMLCNNSATHANAMNFRTDMSIQLASYALTSVDHIDVWVQNRTKITFLSQVISNLWFSYNKAKFVDIYIKNVKN